MKPGLNSRSTGIAAFAGDPRPIWALLGRASGWVAASFSRTPVAIASSTSGILVLLAALAVRSAVGTAETAVPVSQEPSIPQVYQALKKHAQVQSGQEYFSGAHFVGSEACSGCHQKQVEEWRRTWHSKMEQWPTPETVVGDFADQIITYRDIVVTDASEKTKQTVTFQIRTHREGNDFFYTVLDQDDPRNNQTYKIAKTLGGKWDQGYEVKVGDNYYAAPLRYSVKNKGWLTKNFYPQEWVIADGTPDGRPRRPDELNKGRVAEAKCQGCHTTGYQYAKDEKTGTWKSHAAAGDHAELGVGCEQCHGPASKHVEVTRAAKAAGQAPDPDKLHIVHMLKDLDFNQQTQVCGNCHGRGTNKKEPELAFPLGFRPGDRDLTDRHRMWSYSGTSSPREFAYFFTNDWAKRNRQQWQDFTRSKHFNKGEMSCLSCHTFHGKQEDAQLRERPQALCKGCHTATGESKRPNAEMYAGSPMEVAGVTCINCHMGRIAFRTAQTSDTKHPAGDGSSHVFLTATPYLKKASGLRSACDSCHSKGVPMLDDVEFAKQHVFSNDELVAKMEEKKAQVKAAIKAVNQALAGWEPSAPEARALVDQANAKVGFVVLDGSHGLHNTPKALTMLEEALHLARSAAAINAKVAGTPKAPSASTTPSEGRAPGRSAQN